MKFAIDIENEEIKKKVIKNLQDKGHNIVDCIQDKSLNIGESHYKKALLTNITKPEIFLRFIYVKNNDERLEIFADENVLSKVMSFNFEALLEEFNLKQLFMKNGRELYLIKNIECASIIIRMTTSNIYSEEKIAKFLCDLIEMISSKSHKI
ncbi:hypothetical protein [Sarcina ventriculi]